MGGGVVGEAAVGLGGGDGEGQLVAGLQGDSIGGCRACKNWRDAVEIEIANGVFHLKLFISWRFLF